MYKLFAFAVPVRDTCYFDNFNYKASELRLDMRVPCKSYTFTEQQWAEQEKEIIAKIRELERGRECTFVGVE